MQGTIGSQFPDDPVRAQQDVDSLNVFALQVRWKLTEPSANQIVDSRPRQFPHLATSPVAESVHRVCRSSREAHALNQYTIELPLGDCVVAIVLVRFREVENRID